MVCQAESLLRKIFEDDTLTLEFDEETFRFFIHMSGREKFDFNSMSQRLFRHLGISWPT